MSFSFRMAADLFRRRARQCRSAALAMQPSAARTAMERIAARWAMMEEVERRAADALVAANDP